MDNLTHSLIGAALGQAGLKRKTGLAMPALILGANLPDIDAVCVVYGIESLAMRRGITHGPIAMVLLPLLLAWGLWGFDSWQARRGTRPEARLPVHFGWLLALSFIACLTHPLFDWFNNYGVRLLEPFSSRWFYGDTLFIIDPWIIAMLGWGVLYSLRRERAGRKRWRWPAEVALITTAAYVGLNGVVTIAAEQRGGGTSQGQDLVIANNVPITFWRRQIVAREWGKWRTFNYNFFEAANKAPAEIDISSCVMPATDPQAQRDPKMAAFLFWSRAPVAIAAPDGSGLAVYDARFYDSSIRGRFTVFARGAHCAAPVVLEPCGLLGKCIE